MVETAPPPFRTPSPWAWRAALITLAAAVLVVAAGPLTAAGLPWWLGLPLYALAAVVAGLGALVTIFFLLRRRGPRPLLLAVLVAGAFAALIPAGLYAGVRGHPPIHDITTDTADPPQFSALLPVRGDGASPAAYDGPETAALQRTGYPGLAGLLLSVTPRAAFDRALTAARAMGWQIIAADPAQGRIEAVATEPWWGFRDDVVVRIRADGNGSRIDLRSKSRIERGDRGTNARRVREYLARLS